MYGSRKRTKDTSIFRRQSEPKSPTLFRQQEGQAKSQARINHRKAIHGLPHRQEHRERDRMYRSRLAAVHTQGTNG